MKRWRRALALLVSMTLLAGFGLAEEPIEAQEPAAVEVIEEPAEEEAIEEPEPVENSELVEDSEPTEEPESAPEPEILEEAEPGIQEEPEVTPELADESLELEEIDADSDFEIDESGTLLRYRGDDADDITVPSNVTVIGAEAFQNCDVVSVKLPQGLTAIDDSAFAGCTQLRSIEIPQGVTRIGSGAFYDCDALRSLRLPNSVASIGERAFASCNLLESVTLPSGLTSISAATFQDCQNLRAIDIPDGVTSISEAAFSGCLSLESVNFPKGLTRIENETFCSVPFSGTLEIPEGVTSIGERAFAGLDARRLVLPKSLKRIEAEAFMGWSFYRQPLSLTIPGNVEWIGDGAFRGCGWLIRVVAEPGVKELGDGVFQYCEGLSTAKFSEGLTRMGDNVFEGAEFMEELTLPASLTSIGENLFNLFNLKPSKVRLNVVSPAGSYVQSYCQERNIPWRASDGLGAVNANLKEGDEIPIDGKKHMLKWDAVPGAASYGVVVHGWDGWHGEHVEKLQYELDAELFHDPQQIPIGIFAFDKAKQLLAKTEFTLRVVGNGQTLQVEEELDLGAGESYTLKPVSSVKKDSFSYKVVDAKNDETSGAVVSKKGKVTAYSGGNIYVRVTSKKSGLRAWCRIETHGEPDLVELNAEKLTLLKGASFQLSGKIVSGFSNAALKFKSSKPKIAKVDADGTVHALKTGTAKITCSAYNGEKAVCTVEVKSAPKSLRFPEEGIRFSVGQVDQLELEGGYAANFYESSNEAVAIVDEHGICTARQTGTTTVTARTAKGLTASCTLSVVPAPDELRPIADICLGVGGTGKIAPVALYRGEEVPASFSYDSSSACIQVSKDGVVTGRSIGVALVTVKIHNGLRTKFLINVIPAPAKAIPDAKTCKLGTGDSFRLHVDLIDKNGNPTTASMTCKSSKSSIATVEEAPGEPGVFIVKSGSKTGSATITLTTYNGKKASCKVSVTNPPKSFLLNETAMTLGVEETSRLSYTLDKKNLVTGVTWSSTDEAVATVDADGCVTAHGVGSAIIRAVTTGGLSGECALTVLPAPNRLILPDSITLHKGEKYQLVPEIDAGSHCSFSFRCNVPSTMGVTVDPDTGLISVGRKAKAQSAIIFVSTHNFLSRDVFVYIS